MIELRDYQKDLLTGVQSELQPDKARVMMQLPTGGGKTVIAAHLLKNWLVIGLQTWALTRSGEPPDTSIITASDPTNAVEKAIRAAEDRLEAFRHRILN